MDWAQLKTFHQKVISNTFIRKPEVVEAYQQHKQILIKQGAGLTDYLIKLIFGRVKDVVDDEDKEDKDEDKVDNEEEAGADPKNILLWKLIPNQYPYELSPGINHLVFWIHPQANLSLTQAEQYLREELFRRGYSEENFVYFQNEIARRSVPQIEHYQVFVR